MNTGPGLCSTSSQSVCKYQPRTLRYLSKKCLWILAQGCAITLSRLYEYMNTSPGLCDISLGDNKRKWESPVSTTFGKRWPPLGSPHHQRKRSPKKFLHFLLNGTVSQGYRSLFYFMNLQYSNHICTVGLLGHLKQTAKMKQLLKVLGMFFREKKKLIYINYIFFFFIYCLFADIFVSYWCKQSCAQKSWSEWHLQYCRVYTSTASNWEEAHLRLRSVIPVCQYSGDRGGIWGTRELVCMYT